jgi:hypothetical protein
LGDHKDNSDLEKNVPARDQNKKTPPDLPDHSQYQGTCGLLSILGILLPKKLRQGQGKIPHSPVISKSLPVWNLRQDKDMQTFLGLPPFGRKVMGFIQSPLACHA